MKKKPFHVILLFFIILSFVSSCSNPTERKSTNAEQAFNSLECLLPFEGVSLGITEGELVALFGEGTRHESGKVVTCVYPTKGDTPYSPTHFLSAGQNVNDVKYPKLSFYIGYGFGETYCLETIMYQYDLTNVPPEDVQSFFEDVYSLLSDKYGEPRDEVEKWLDERYINDSIMIKTAVERGDYKRIAMWESDNQTVIFNIGNSCITYTNNVTDIINITKEMESLK